MGLSREALFKAFSSESTATMTQLDVIVYLLLQQNMTLFMTTLEKFCLSAVVKIKLSF